MGRFLMPFIREIVKYKFTILLLVYLCFIVLYPNGFTLRLLPIAGCLSILFLLNIIAKIRFYHLFAGLLICLITFNAYIAIVYSSYVSSSLIAVIFESNANEVRSAAIGIILPVIGLLLLTSVLLLLSIRELKSLKLNIKTSILSLALFLSLLSTISFRRILIITDMREEYNESPVAMFSEAMNYYSPMIYGNVMVITSYIYDIYLFNNYKDSERANPEGIISDENKKQVEKIFIVIGESATPKHMSIYGYEIPTTPFLDSLSQISDKLSFFEGRAVASQTRNAVPGILSSNSGKDTKRFRDESSVVDLAKQHGYTTYWLSNQMTSGLWNGRDIIAALASRTDYSEFFSRASLEDDFVLLPEVEKYYKSNSEKQLFVLHLQGSHFLYKERYDQVDESYLPGESTVERDYDRTIYHTDRFLRQLYSYIEEHESAILFYLSDHGQEIKEQFGHGVGKPTKAQFYVPLVAINNSHVAVDSVMMKYIDTSDSIISNNCMPSIAAEVMGYQVLPSTISEVVEDGKFVLHGDDKTYRYSDLD